MKIQSVQSSMPNVCFKGHITDQALRYAINSSNKWFDRGPSIISPKSREDQIINKVKEELAKDTVIDLCYDVNYDDEIKPRMLIYNSALNESAILLDFHVGDLYPGNIKDLDTTLEDQFIRKQRNKLIETGNVKEVSGNLAEAARNYGKHLQGIENLIRYIDRYKKAMTQLPKFKSEKFSIDFEEQYDLRVRSYKKWIRSGAVLDKKI